MKKSNYLIIRISKVFDQGKFFLKFAAPVSDNEYFQFMPLTSEMIDESHMMFLYKTVKETALELLLRLEGCTTRPIKYTFGDEISGTSRFVDPETDQERSIRRLSLPITKEEAMLIFPHLP